MEEFDSPRVLRSLVPSPLRPTPSPAKKENMRTFDTSPLPQFILDLDMEKVVNTNDDVVDLPKHYLPDFQFRMTQGYPNPTSEQFKQVASYFPGCSLVAYTPPFLVVSWQVLPQKPWPLTFGRIPLFYATPKDRRPPTFGRAGGSPPMVIGDCLKPSAHPQERIKGIAQVLVNQGIGVRFFGWSGVHWYVEVTSPTDGAKLPATICGLLLLWKVHQENEESARRKIIPDGGTIIDNTSYVSALRPGVIVESKGGQGSTSGIPLVGSDGKRWISVANHGFTKGDEGIYHPNYVEGEDKLIGTVQHRFINSDIALAELQSGLTYSATSFDGEEVNGTTLGGLTHSKDIELLESLFLDSPYNGKCEGMVAAIGYHILPARSSNGEFNYVECNMIYFGNGANDIFPGTCGSAMWTVEKKVAGFLSWYYSKDAIAFSSSVDILIESGYAINAIL